MIVSSAAILATGQPGGGPMFVPALSFGGPGTFSTLTVIGASSFGGLATFNGGIVSNVAADGAGLFVRANGGGDQIYIVARAAGNGTQINSRNAADTANAPLRIGASAITMGGPTIFSNGATFNNFAQFTSGAGPTSGAGVEIAYNAGVGTLQSFNRGGPAFTQLNIEGSVINLGLNSGGATTIAAALALSSLGGGGGLVSVGIANSGGVGFRQLIVPN